MYGQLRALAATVVEVGASDDLPKNKSARRRALRQRHAAARQRPPGADRMLPGHLHDKNAAMSSVDLEAAAYGIEDLVRLTDEQLAQLPDGAIEEARWQFQDQGRATIDDVAGLTQLVVAVCAVWADLQPAGDMSALTAMWTKCGLTYRTRVGVDETNYDVGPDMASGRFFDVAMLLATRVALVDK